MGQFRRLLWHVNRTRLSWVVKAGVSTLHWPEKVKRRRIARSFEATPEVQTKAEELRRDGYTLISDIIDDGLVRSHAAN